MPVFAERPKCCTISFLYSFAIISELIGNIIRTNGQVYNCNVFSLVIPSAFPWISQPTFGHQYEKTHLTDWLHTLLSKAACSRCDGSVIALRGGELLRGGSGTDASETCGCFARLGIGQRSPARCKRRSLSDFRSNARFPKDLESLSAINCNLSIECLILNKSIFKAR